MTQRSGRGRGFGSGRRCALGLVVLLPLLGLAGSCNNSTGPGRGGGELRTRWYERQSGESNARPAVSGSTVYFGTGIGQVIARDVNTGAVRWSTFTGAGDIDGAKLVVRSGVVVAPAINSTVGLDAETGAILWRYEAPPDTVAWSGSGQVVPGQVVQSRIDADAELVYIPAWGASVSAVDLKTGVARWVWQPGKTATDTAASGVFRSGSMGVRVSGDTVFATAWHYLTRLGVPAEAWVIAIERSTGRELWRVTLPDQGAAVFMEAAPVVSGNLVIVHTLTTRTYGIDRTSPRIVWEFTAPGEVGNGKNSTIAGPELYGDVVYVDGGDGNVYALRASDGSVVWKGAVPNAASRDMLVTERRILFVHGSTIDVLDRLTGARVASGDQPNTSDPLISSPPAYANGTIFVTAADAAWAFYEP